MQSIVFADVRCPFTHVGLRRFVQRRDQLGRTDVVRVRLWPVELVNDEPLDPIMIGEVVDDPALKSPLSCSRASTRTAFPRRRYRR